MPTGYFHLAALVSGAYLLGSILPAELLARRRLGKRVGEVNSRENPGAAGSWRLMGPLAGVAVALFDIAKGALPVLLALRLGVSTPWLVLLAAAPVIGHNWPLFYRFQGGRGLATGVGALLCLAPLPFVIALALGIPFAFYFRWTPALGVVGFPLGVVLILCTKGTDPHLLGPVLAVIAVVLSRQIPWLLHRGRQET
ncbi:MAG TPA: glycerol-3-phosphate acyltransferase [Firmicutes bacterium]|nr:glycerol-3-phosphate acyltransferase [Bacillota bacterium]